MSLGRFLKILLGGLLVLAVLFAIAIEFSFIEPSGSAPNQNEQYQAGKQAVYDAFESLASYFIDCFGSLKIWFGGLDHNYIIAYSTAVIMVFTAILGFSTIFLWLATRKAANAAKEAAQYIPIVERAWLFGGPNPEGFVSNGDVLEFKVRIYNYGKTPGIVREIWWDAVANEPLSPEVKYVDGNLHKLDIAFAGGDGGPIHQLTLSAKPSDFFIGYIAYDDIFKKSHMSRFCLRVGPPRFETAGHPAWNDYD
jgi:flagellar basal body-associated protein FliL